MITQTLVSIRIDFPTDSGLECIQFAKSLDAPDGNAVSLAALKEYSDEQQKQSLLKAVDAVKQACDSSIEEGISPLSFSDLEGPNAVDILIDYASNQGITIIELAEKISNEFNRRIREGRFGPSQNRY